MIATVDWRAFQAADIKTHDEAMRILGMLISEIVKLTEHLDRYERDGTVPPGADDRWPQRARSVLTRFKMQRADVERQAGILRFRERDEAVSFRRAAERLLPADLLERIRKEQYA